VVKQQQRNKGERGPSYIVKLVDRPYFVVLLEIMYDICHVALVHFVNDPMRPVLQDEVPASPAAQD
jgi:hypothetical protein